MAKEQAKPTSGGVRAYARHRGLKSDNSVRKAITAGRIVYEADGKTIDFATADKAWSSNTDPAQQREQKSPKHAGGAPPRATQARNAAAAGAPPAAAAAPPGSKRDKQAADHDHAVSDDTLGLANEILRRHGKSSSGGGFTMVDARTAETLQKMEQRQIEIDRERGKLISRRVLDKVFAAARQERDSWLQWIVRDVAEMAVALGVPPHALEVTLNKHVRKQLESLAGIDITL